MGSMDELGIGAGSPEYHQKEVRRSASRILLFSGGLDSTTLLWKLKPDVKCLLFNYGQRHVKELQSARRICDVANVTFKTVDLGISLGIDDHVSVSDLMVSGSQTSSDPVPEGHYTDESMKKTVVPNRNMIMLAIATGWAVSTGAKEVYWACHAGDHSIYPDCRPEFYCALREAIHVGNQWSPIHLQAPFIYNTKAEIVNQGLALGVPYELTWSCYKGNDKPCGKCGTCVERLEAFSLNGVKDPLEYEIG